MKLAKYLSLILSLAIALSGFAACNNESGNGGETTDGDTTEGTSSTTEVTTAVTTDATTENTTSEPTENTTEETTEITTEATTEVTTETTEEITYEIREVDERYFIFRMWNFEVMSLRDFQKMVDTVSEDGFNAIKIHVPWNHVEKVDGVYDYGTFDDMVDYVINDKEMKVAISLDLTRVEGDGLLPDDDFMRNIDGELSMGGMNNGNRMQISLNSEHAMEKAVAFYRHAVAHYDKLYGDDILFYLPAFSQYAETEYYPSNGGYDYSDRAVNGFRAFLMEKYPSVDQLNQAIGKDFKSFEDVTPPSCDAADGFGHLWFIYRHESLKGAIDKLAAAQDEVAPDTKIAVQFGSVWGSQYMRATAGFASLCENIDVLWVDDGPAANHLFSMDYMRTVIPASVELAQEMDGPLQINASPENYLNQGMQCFERGAKYVSSANFHMDSNYEKYRTVWQTIAETWLGKNAPAIANPTPDSPVMTVSLRELFYLRNMNALMAKYESLAPNDEFVIINIIDDLTTTLPSATGATYSFPANYSTIQGENNWYYMSHLGGNFTEMTYSTETNRWQGASPYTLVSSNSLHPDTHDSAVVFKVPKSGTITCTVSASLMSDASDGIVFFTLHNKETVKMGENFNGRIYVNYQKPLAEKITITVEEGDEIAFIVNRYGTNHSDATSVSIYIEYTE